MREKYKEYGITETPYVVVKADAGTYGMGVMTVKDASEITGLNRKQRNKMSVIKEGMSVSQVIIQEGVHTNERVSDGVAEPVVYMIDRFVVGGFYRVHSGRAKDENLNAPGMHFEPAGLRDELLPARPVPEPRRATQPLLRLRRRCAPGAARRVAGVGTHGAGGRGRFINKLTTENTEDTEKKLSFAFLCALRALRGSYF